MKIIDRLVEMVALVHGIAGKVARHDPDLLRRLGMPPPASLRSSTSPLSALRADGGGARAFGFASLGGGNSVSSRTSVSLRSRG